MIKVEVSAIMEAGNGRIPISLSPCGEKLYLYRNGAWYCPGTDSATSAMERWNYFADQGPESRKIHRGILKIKVSEGS